MTAAATAFVAPLTFQALSGHPVRTTLLDPAAEAGMGHIELARWADLILMVAPATADLIARLAAGLADDLPTTLVLASAAPLYLAPAMNQAMWRHPATQDNLATPARARGADPRARPRAARPAATSGRGGCWSREIAIASLAVVLPPADRGAGAPRGGARPGDRRPDPRAAGPGALPRQPQLRAHGVCRGAGPGGARGRGCAWSAVRRRSRTARRGSSGSRWRRPCEMHAAVMDRVGAVRPLRRRRRGRGLPARRDRSRDEDQEDRGRS